MSNKEAHPDNAATKLPRRKKPPARPKGTVTALDLDGSILRIAQGSLAGAKFEIQSVAAETVEVPEPKTKDEVKLTAASIGKALTRAKVKAGQVILGVGKGQAVLRPLIVPAVPDFSELASMIHFQIAKDLPFRLEDAVVDFTVLRVLEPISSASTTPDEGIDPKPAEAAAQARYEVLVAAVKKDVVDFHKNVAEAAGLKLAGLGLRPHAHARALSLGGGATPGAVGIFSVRQDESTVEIVVDGRLIFSRSVSVPTPAHLLTGGAKPGAEERKDEDNARFISGMVVEFMRSLHSYEGMMWHKPPAQIVVAGALGIEKDLVEALSKRVQVPVTIWNPQPLVTDGEPKPDVCRGSMAAIGLAAGLSDAEGLPIDFLNPKRPAAPRNTKQIRIVLAAAASLVILISLFATRHHYVKKRLKIQAEVQEQLAQAEKKLPVYRKLRTQAKAVRAWMDDGQPWLDHCVYLTSVLPGAEEIYVSSIATTSQRMIRLSLQAKSGETLIELDKKLRAAGYDVKPLSVTPANDKYGYPFKTTVELVVPAKMKLDLKKYQPPPRPADDATKTVSIPLQRGEAPSLAMGSPAKAQEVAQ